MRGVCAVWALFSLSCGEDARLEPLTIHGVFEPAGIDFTEVLIGSSERIPVELVNDGEGSLTIERLELADYRIDLEAGRTLQPAARAPVMVEFAPTVLGERAGTIVVHPESGDPIELMVRGVGASPGELSHEPASLDFGTIDLGFRAVLPLTIRGSAIIDTARLDNGSFSLVDALPLAISGSRTIEIAFAPLSAGTHTDRLRLVSSDGSALSIPLIGSVRDAPGGLSCGPTPIDFGDLERGMRSTVEVSCVATGPVRVSQISLPAEPPQFVLGEAAPIDLNAGESLGFTVEFRAEGPLAELASQISIDYQGPLGAASLSIPLSASVIAPEPTATAISLQLQWNTFGSDLDVHLVRMGGAPFARDGGDCHFGVRAPDWGVLDDPSDDPYLDLDDLDGYGPENINLSQTGPGDYEVYVHYYADRGGGPTTGELIMHLGGMHAGTFARALGCRELWHVGTIQWDGIKGTILTRDLVTTRPEGNCP